MREPKRFLVRTLDIEGTPLWMKLVSSVEEGVGIYQEMTNASEFIEDEDLFVIEQGAETIHTFAIRRDSCIGWGSQ